MTHRYKYKQQTEIHISQLVLHYLYTLSRLFKHHQNTLSLKPKDWQKIEVKQGKTQTIHDIETTVNYLDLMVLNN